MYIPDTILDQVFSFSEDYNFRTICKEWLNIRPLAKLMMDKYDCWSTIMRKASRQGDEKLCKEALNNIDFANVEPKHPPEVFLFDAVRGGNLDICKMLIAHDWGYTLRYTCIVMHDGHTDGLDLKWSEVECFSEYTINTYLHDALCIAIELKKESIAEYLLNEYSDIMFLTQDDFFSELMDFARAGDYNMCRILLSNIKYTIHCSSWAMIVAAENGYLDICKLLHMYGAQPSYCNSRSLQNAARIGNYGIVVFLTTTREFNAKPCHDNSSSLKNAAENGHYEICEYLLDHNIFGRSVAKPKKMNSQALVASIQAGHHDITKLLIERGGDPTMSVCLKIAAHNNDLRMCDILVKHGADPFVVDLYDDELVNYLRNARKSNV